MVEVLSSAGNWMNIYHCISNRILTNRNHTKVKASGCFLLVGSVGLGFFPLIQVHSFCFYWNILLSLQYFKTLGLFFSGHPWMRPKYDAHSKDELTKCYSNYLNTISRNAALHNIPLSKPDDHSLAFPFIFPVSMLEEFIVWKVCYAWLLHSQFPWAIRWYAKGTTKISGAPWSVNLNMNWVNAA